ncbi:relaxase/mobilization nuclease RlxS [Sphingomonas sp. NIBR02145]|uniref:relaxase/mobilization nuclease RlxS n=1 Tax=Sphingomonas sp. NIBR02145 TaxID=3014784 RepID=UPI0022B36AA5|nr:relaxase/mobilization nuclease RlxS [Sphingomonas sp. NIBR02145]WHU03672.1 relaxase/mobilization nuclease RlxS [Sphingomonas sp. NIBR02145]
MAEDDFMLWLGHIGKERPFAHRVRKAVNLAGGTARANGSGKPRFLGSRARGAGVGRVLGMSDRFPSGHSRRVIVKARYVKLAGKGAKAAVAHLRYLQRDGTTREGERGTLYGPESDVADGKAFLERGQGDRHQFRFIVAPEDGAQYDDLKPLIRRWMAQIEEDLGTGLDWVAVDHFNTGHPHSHVLVRGKDDRGKDLIIAREYITRGLAERAAELVNLDLGPRTDREIRVAREREITQERFTGIDRRLLLARDGDGLVSAWHHEGVEQSLRAARLGTLARMGLAKEEGKGRYRLEEGLEDTLRAMGKRGDIIATMHGTMVQHAPEVPPQDYAIYDPGEGKALVGRVIKVGLSDEHEDRRYMIVAATDGRSHYVDLGRQSFAEMVDHPEIVRVKPVVPAVREADRTVAEVAAANGGIYSVDAHLQHDPGATSAFAETHVRRLEAIRRGGGGVERHPDGSWKITPDHLDRVLLYARNAAAARPVELEALADRSLDVLAHHHGMTWLDEQNIAQEPEKLERGFGAEVRNALAARRQWLIEQGLAWREGDAVHFQPGLLSELRQRELRQVAGQLSRELGLEFVEHKGGRVEGVYSRAVQVGAARYAVIEKSKEFTLVPWRPALEKQVGRLVSGIDRGGSISWTFGRSRAGPSVE